ncbi:tubulin-specific chaperone E-like isoform X2 [Corticium candelabrum]|uniref:tubulin-specific chaperone E-like isoform X2 n=1 Tax=Corticium candelabrum TaxID=121492 RepID=UPI002E25AA35|nr:tubulin-specific chaperone E-like isoform X2 [Corticium candelabrum]
MAEDILEKRVVCDGHFGTVKFVGEIQSKLGKWIGVEWDDPTRGKHNGSYNGVRYFQSSHASGGSFVRANKVNLGRTVREAVIRRYGKLDTKENEDDTDDDDDDGMLEVCGKVVEIVASRKVKTKQSHFDKCLEITLHGMEISSSGADEEIKALFPNLTTIDLSNNLLSDWQNIADIVQQLPSLTSLDLSGNRLKPYLNADQLHHCFGNISRLFMNRMCLYSQQITLIASMMPNLTELHLCYNNITELNRECNLHMFRKLLVLNLEGNGIHQWEDVLTLQQLPCLSTLILNSNSLREVVLESSDCGFSNLQAVSLTRNHIDSWQSINALSLLSSLRSLRVKQNPLFGREQPFEARQQIIARIPQLTHLEGSKVSKKERQLAELYYLKRYANDWVTAGANRLGSTRQQTAEFHQLHPIYAALVKDHGEPEISHQPGITRSLKDNLLEITISFPDDSTKTPITKKLPASLTIQKLKGLIQRLCRVDISQQRLTYKETENGPEYTMDDNMRSLAFYSVKSGNIVVVRC